MLGPQSLLFSLVWAFNTKIWAWGKISGKSTYSSFNFCGLPGRQNFHIIYFINWWGILLVPENVFGHHMQNDSNNVIICKLLIWFINPFVIYCMWGRKPWKQTKLVAILHLKETLFNFRCVFHWQKRNNWIVLRSYVESVSLSFLRPGMPNGFRLLGLAPWKKKKRRKSTYF